MCLLQEVAVETENKKGFHGNIDFCFGKQSGTGNVTISPFCKGISIIKISKYIKY